ncbi:hypothetical protein HGP14_10120 [Rhizobium sp. P32RR-XVIII]|uniref:FAD-dependent oxidoreductase n=1 Tax=Rhizobium sp. P32RR-XVIII TaxID=2726738 RepID=UPI0014569428|nr:FAD-dependent oxidoreductase [Rhizobium sp. P32RR-XVIII]NLS03713.1 hypothetical protein [Rhizobium sp. P32RR-XVIII]
MDDRDFIVRSHFCNGYVIVTPTIRRKSIFDHGLRQKYLFVYFHDPNYAWMVWFSLVNILASLKLASFMQVVVQPDGGLVMFADLNGVPPQWCEVCVVGAGPVGLAVALTLAANGIRTLLLESGAERPDRRTRELSSLASYNEKHHHSSEATVVRALGGTSLRWGGRCVEYNDIDFEQRDYVTDSIWPIGHDALKPFYAAARKMLTADHNERPDDAGDDIFELSLESWTRTQNTARANFNRLQSETSLKIVKNCTATKLHLDVDTGRLRALTAITGRSSRLIDAPHFVLAGGGRENTRLLLELQREKPDLFGGLDGPLGRFYMGHLTGEISTITFASAARAAKFLFKSSRSGTVIRERFVPTAGVQKANHLLNIAFWPDSLRPDEVIVGNGAVSLFYMARHLIRRSRDPVFRNSISAREASSAHFRNIAIHPMQTLYGSSRLLVGKFLSPERYPQFSFVSPTNTYLLRYHAEHSPFSRSRVTLSPATDANGSHRLDVDFRYSPEDFRSVMRAHRLLGERLEQTGMGRLTFLRPEETLEEWIAAQAIDGYHQIGLTRMSSDRHKGIVDGDCRTHDVANLFVAGSSVFPSSSQANPTLPAVAMSLRLAAHLTNLVDQTRRPPALTPGS